MFRKLRWLFLVAGILVNMQNLEGKQLGADNDPLWQAVQQALNEGRPQTALEKLQPIEQRAQQSSDLAEKILVLVTKIDLETLTTESAKPDTRLKKLRQAIDQADEPMRPVLEAIQAAWLWQFFNEHRWQFANRTAVALPANSADESPVVPAPDDDLLTWDLARILRAIDGQFARSLAAAETLKQTPVDRFQKVLTKGNVPTSYRPTMYDILVHHALAFYTTAEQVGSRSANAFDLTADSPVFGNAEEFVAWQPQTTDDRAPLLVAVRLYQDLMRFHADDDDATARLDADLQRLHFANAHASGEDKTDRYQTALRRFQSASSDLPIWAQATVDLAQLIHQQDDPAAARQLAQQALERFPGSVGANQAYNLIQQIESREVQIRTERVWNVPWPQIVVNYRNVDKVYFRLVSFDFQQFARNLQRWQPENLDDNGFRRIMRTLPVKSWSEQLPPTTDYRSREQLLDVPQDLKRGPYLLLSSHREDFAEQDNQIGIAEVWVSDLALSIRTGDGEGTVGGLVLNANTGLPIANAKVRAWEIDRRGQGVTEVPSVQTSADGEFEFNADTRQRLLLLASHGEDQLSSANMLYSNRYPTSRGPVEQTQFFTDRSIYRPGQTIRFKGVCHFFDQQQDKYQVIGNRKVTVALFDSNNQEVEKIQTRCNEYGSFSGSFTAPRGRLTGMMWLRVIGGPSGQGMVRVEEYKRPKFEVAVDAPTESAKLGELVQVTGKATAYTGAFIDGASVQWRVVREVRYPQWWYWRMWWAPPVSGEQQEIARGTSTTDASGAFEIGFVAKPDASVSPDSEPTFQYSIYADVTDTTGETRSAQRTISAGYTALSISLSAADWLMTDKATELNVRTTTLDGQAQSAAGQLKIYALKQPDRVQRADLSGHRPYPRGRNQTPPTDDNNPNSWPLAEVVFDSAVQTDGAGNQKLEIELPAGIYRAIVESKDRFGKAVKAELPLRVFDLKAPRWNVKLPQDFHVEQTSVEPGQTFRALWSSGYDAARAFVEIEHRGQIIKHYWTDANATQAVIELPITEKMRGGFTVHTTFVHENRAYFESRRIDVPWSNKHLDIKWERFTSKLEPAQKEVWTAIVSGQNAERAVAEMVATLYDESLDVFAPHSWQSGFPVFRQDFSRLQRQFGNLSKYFQQLRHTWQVDYRDVTWNYSTLQSFANGGGMNFRGRPMMMARGGGFGGEMMGADAMPAPAGMAFDSAMAAPGAPVAEGEVMAKSVVANEAAPPESDGAGSQVSLDGIPVRTNLNETAFFFPHAIADKDGSVKLEFTMPEALTRWKFMGFAHDKELRGGLLMDHVTTSKDLMIQPNPPRFLREGDQIEFTVKVTNLSATSQTGQAALNFVDPITGESLDALLANSADKQAFEIPAGSSQSLSWKLAVPDGLTMLTYRAKASTGRIADGEEGYLPVLSRRILVTESLPLAIRGAQTKEFVFERLLKSGESDSLKHQSLTVQMASNPAWYAVMSLPYLMEYPHQCSEQIFNRLYANSLAQHIAGSDPKIQRVFEQWRGTEALVSPLAKNADLKSVVLEESPWVQDAQVESQARRNVGILFDQNRLTDEVAHALAELADRQLDDGRWAWFPGGNGNDYITLYIMTGFGRLQHLGVKLDPTQAIRCLSAMDAWMVKQHRDALESMRRTGWKAGDKPTNFLGSTMAMYLYGRSFYLPEHPIAAEHQDSLKFWQEQSALHWMEVKSLQSQAHLALAAKRLGDTATAGKIMVSLKERSLSNDELGTYWRTSPDFYWWYHAPIESQATLIEAFDEVAHDAEMVENCKVWLLKQKQTQNWKTTKATADAVYALLLRGANVLASDKVVEVKLGGELIRPSQVEAGTGFYEQRRQPSDISADLARVTVTKRDAGVAWGSVHWQYFEDIDRITANPDNPLNLTKELYVKRNTDTGAQLFRVGEGDAAAEVKVGDELVCRVVLRVDRDMEYVHLKDHRGSGTEPVNVLSGYRYQDGLGYYESTRDAASHFFIDYLSKGTYVFEYSTRVQLRGDYQTGMAEVQCMYAPEFNSHSQSIRLQAK